MISVYNLSASLAGVLSDKLRTKCTYLFLYLFSEMFDRYKDGQNIYFDLDVLIKGDCNHFLRTDFHVCHAWWRDAWHTPLNSSIMSWQGDQSQGSLWKIQDHHVQSR